MKMFVYKIEDKNIENIGKEQFLNEIKVPEEKREEYWNKIKDLLEKEYKEYDNAKYININKDNKMYVFANGLSVEKIERMLEIDNKEIVIEREKLDNCKELSIEASGTSGTRYKVWLIKDGKEILFKESKLHTGGEDTYEDVSEIISYQIGKILGFNVIPVGLGEYKGHKGSYTYKVNDLIELSNKISDKMANYNSNYPFENIEYNFDFVESFFEDKEQFYKLLIFDYIRAEVDRHPSNIGFIGNGINVIYDNGNSFGSFLYEDEIEKETRKIAKYCGTIFKSCIGLGNVRPVLWNDVIYKNKDKLKKYFKKIIDKENEIYLIIDKLKIDKLSSIRKVFIKEMLKYKIDYIRKNI